MGKYCSTHFYELFMLYNETEIAIRRFIKLISLKNFPITTPGKTYQCMLIANVQLSLWANQHGIWPKCSFIVNVVNLMLSCEIAYQLKFQCLNNTKSTVELSNT
ncbi:unnamed protein product [Clavelina lepadiformis]|uniref:Uncharacterized protein n=1 Tax=Clavelina lepadiformis TaxID=159417 RepID=A0ABP0GFV2_CLALP